MRIVTFNIRMAVDEKNPRHNWERRLPRILTQLKKENGDILAFQEVTLGQFEDLRANLPDYEAEYVSRDLKGGEGTPLFYRKERFDLLEKGSFFLNEHPSSPGIGWDAGCPRVSSYLVLREKNGSRPFSVFNVHLDPFGKKAQVKGLELILARHEELGHDGFVLGDFNPGNEPYELASSRLMDAKPVSGSYRKGTFHDYGNIDCDKTEPIDFVFVSEGIKVNSFEVLDEKVDGEYASDHYLLSSDFELR